MSNDNIKVIEKHYIEVNPSAKHKFLLGILQGLGWGVGVTLGTATVIILVGYFVSRIDWVPIIGQVLQNIVDSAQQNPTRR